VVSSSSKIRFDAPIASIIWLYSPVKDPIEPATITVSSRKVMSVPGASVPASACWPPYQSTTPMPSDIAMIMPGTNNARTRARRRR
jgi:hypothetical protein